MQHTNDVIRQQERDSKNCAPVSSTSICDGVEEFSTELGQVNSWVTVWFKCMGHSGGAQTAWVSGERREGPSHRWGRRGVDQPHTSWVIYWPNLLAAFFIVLLLVLLAGNRWSYAEKQLQPGWEVMEKGRGGAGGRKGSTTVERERDSGCHMRKVKLKET